MRGDTASAIIELKGVLSDSPNSGEARLLLGRAFLADDNPSAALIELRRAKELSVRPDLVFPHLAKALLQLREYKKIIEEFGAIKLSDRNAEANLQLILAEAYALQDRFADAEMVLGRLLTDDPENSSGLVLQARLLGSRGRSPDSIAVLERVLAKDRKNLDALVVKANNQYRGLNDLVAASKTFAEVLAVDPKNVTANSELISIDIANGDLSSANARFLQMQKKLPGAPQTKFLEAQLAYFRGDYEAASAALQPLLKSFQDNWRLLYFSGAVDLQRGQIKRAEVSLQKALMLHPSGVGVRRLLAQAQLRFGNAEKALATLRPLVGASSDEDTLTVAAEALLISGDAGGAESIYRRLTKMNPESPKARTALAMLQISKGDVEVALIELGRLAAKDSSTVADMALISAKVLRGDFDGALRAIETLEGKIPDKPLAYSLRADVLARKKELASARIYYDKALQRQAEYFPAVAGLTALDLESGSSEAAIKRLEGYIKLVPETVPARLALAEILATSGKQKERSVGLLKDAIAASPLDSSPRLRLINFYLASGDAKSALVAAQDAAAALPDEFEILDSLGRSFLASGDLQQAAATFRRLTLLQPKSAVPHMRMADVYLAQANGVAAMDALRQALTVSKEQVEIRRRMISLALHFGKPEQALDIARELQRKQPSNALGYVFEAEVEVRRQNWDAAIVAYRQALSKEPTSNKVASAIHRLLRSYKQAGSAVGFEEEWLKKYPADVGFLQYLGDLAASMNDFVEAERRYMAVQKLQPDSPINLNNLAWVLVQQKKSDALMFAVKANRILPGKPEFLDTLAEAQLVAGMPDDAAKSLAQALSAAPARHDLRLKLAKVYIQLGKSDASKAELRLLNENGASSTQKKEAADLLSSLPK